MNRKVRLSGLTAVMILHLFAFPGSAQEKIDGYWLSSDSTRIYKVATSDSGYTAILYASKRPNEKPGALVMSNVASTRKPGCYRGLIHAVDDGLTRTVQVEAKQGWLVLKLPRMLIMPVIIKWYQLENIQDSRIIASFSLANVE